MKQTESFVGVPANLNALIHKDYRSAYLEVYIAIRSLVSLSPLKDNFCICFPSTETIGMKYRLTPELVLDAIAWLERKGYLYRLPRGRRPITYTIVLERERFLRVREEEGPDRAIEANEDWMDRQCTEARNKIKGKGSRSIKPETPNT